GKVAIWSARMRWPASTRTTAEPSAATNAHHQPAREPRMQDEARRALEAIIMVADQPAEPALLGQLVELSPAAVEDLLTEVAASYEAENRGFQLVKVAGGWR